MSAVKVGAKAVEAAKKLSSKKQLTDNINSHLSHTSLSYASDPSAIISKMRKKLTLSDGTIAGVKAPLRLPKVPKTPKQEERQLVGRLDYLHLLHPTRVSRPAGSEVAHIKEPNLQEAVTIDASPGTLRQQEEYIRSLKNELHGEKAPATVITDSEQEQIDKLIADIKHPTEVKEPSGAQTVKEASATTGGSDVRTRKTGGMRKIPGRYDENYKNFQVTGTKTNERPAGSSRDNTQVTDTGTNPDTDATKPDKIQAAQPGSEKKRAGTQSGGDYNPAEFMEKAKDQNLGRSERQMLERLGNMRANAQKVFDKGTDEQIKNELGRWGIERREGAAAADYMKDIDEILKKKAESGPTIGDKFRAHHGVGLTGLGVVGVSTLDLANSRGQQSNAQLYSDPFA